MLPCPVNLAFHSTLNLHPLRERPFPIPIPSVSSFVPVTSLSAISFQSLPSNSHRIYLFRNTPGGTQAHNYQFHSKPQNARNPLTKDNLCLANLTPKHNASTADN